jgi:hypothetical protein
MEHCYEDTDLCWDADECHDADCNGGNCRAIKAQLLYQRKRNQFMRDTLLKHQLLHNETLGERTIKGLIEYFRADYYAKNKEIIVLENKHLNQTL